MLEAFDSDDPKAQEEAQKRVDNYLKDRQRKHDEEMLNKKVRDSQMLLSKGCVTLAHHFGTGRGLDERLQDGQVEQELREQKCAS